MDLIGDSQADLVKIRLDEKTKEQNKVEEIKILK